MKNFITVLGGITAISTLIVASINLWEKFYDFEEAPNVKAPVVRITPQPQSVVLAQSQKKISIDLPVNPPSKNIKTVHTAVKKPKYINFASLDNGVEISSELEHLITPPEKLTDLIDQKNSSYISMNASQLKKFTYALQLSQPVKVSKIVFNRPAHRDPINYLKTVEISVKSSVDKMWGDVKTYQLAKEKLDSVLIFKVDYPVLEIKINPIDNWNPVGGFTYLGDISIIGKPNIN